MLLRRLSFLIAVVAVLMVAPPVSAANRVALVIGNDAYQHLAPLQKAVNDARAVGDALSAIGFQVFKGENLTRREANRLVANFEASLRPGDQAFVFYAGHGVAIRGENILIPVDMPKPNNNDEELVRDEGTITDNLVRRVQARGAGLAIFVIDACRDNPFEATGVRSIGTARGLARSEAPQGVLMIHSASPGQTALDRLSDADPDPNSVFTRQLVPLLREPGLDHFTLAKRLQTGVYQLAGTIRHNQLPDYVDRVIGQVVLNPGEPRPAGGGTALQPTPAASVTAPSPSPTQPPASPPTQVAGTFPVARPSGPVSCADRPRLVSASARPVRPLSADEMGCLQPKDVFKECDNCPELVVIPAGSFTMGSPASEEGRSKDEGPQRTVTIGRPLAVGRYPITVDQYRAFVEATSRSGGSKCWTFENGKLEERSGRSWRNPGFPQSGDHPVACVNWDDAQAYEAWLSRTTGQPYRLLTESEWEYAARSRTEPGRYSRYFYGDEASSMCRYGNGADRTAKRSIKGASGWTFFNCDDGHAYTSPVGTFESNGFGLHDVYGNVSQWVEDCYVASYRDAPSDGSAQTTNGCEKRLLRGGSWEGIPRGLRSAYRFGTSPNVRSVYIGFRIARSLPL